MTQIRKFIPVLSEYQQAIAIENANFPDEDITIQSWKWHDQHYDPNTIFSRWVGEMDGKIVSHGLFTQVQQQTLTKNRYFLFHIAVHPAFHGKGYGTELYQHLNRNLQQYNPCTIETIARENYPLARQFLEHRKFKPTLIKRTARLMISSSSQPINLPMDIERLAKLGIAISALDSLILEDHDWKKKLYSTEKNLMQEAPDFMEHFPATQAEYEIHRMQSSFFNPQSIFIARYHEHWIGIAGIQQSEMNQYKCNHTLTGVTRPYRRNGIATLLRQHCINAALELGYNCIESNCDTGNPLYGINQRLGYKPQPASIHYQLTLQ
ncbi:MAG: GNAT family N-acetyltransferase [Anaerolineaceae bacterium]|nr:GNAT family N-acetyltransferase [Anaerolineaceae bacterium]